MIKSYFILALRNFKKDKVNTLTSLCGLVVGLTCVILITGYIRYEFSFDKSQNNAGRVFRLISKYKKNDYGKSDKVPYAFASTLTREIPEVEAQTHIGTYAQKALIKDQFNDFVGSEVDSSFFSVFHFRFIAGNSASALKSPENIVITVSTAKKFYNTVDVIGKTFTTKEKVYIISGVVEDAPNNFFLHTDAFVFLPAVTQVLDVSGEYAVRNAFILLRENTSRGTMQKKIIEFCHKYKIDNFQISLQPLPDIHLHSSDIKDNSDYFNIGDLKYVYIYGCIALLILIIGCINFINLSIARSLERTKEVGVRKVLGARKRQLMAQFFGESTLYFVLALPLAFVFACSLWPGFTRLLNVQAELFYLLNIHTLLFITGICILSSLLSCAYPAVFLSKLLPVNTLKGGQANQQVNLKFGLRKILVAAQFTISIALIVATIVVHWQLNFINNRQLGFNKDNLIRFDIPFLKQFPSAFKNSLLQNPNILSVSASSTDIGKDYSGSMVIKNPKDTASLLNCVYLDADVDFLKTVQTPVIQGRDFSTIFPSDVADYDTSNIFGADKARPIVVSKSFINALDIKDPIGKQVDAGVFVQGTIIGIIDQFNGTSSKEKDPLVIIRHRANGSYLTHMYVRIQTANTAATIDAVSKIHRKFFPQDKFDYSFIDSRIAHIYDSELRLTKLFNIFAILAILLSAMGMLSLVSLMLRKRSKEMGIRKVMGANAGQLFILVSKNFMQLVFIAFLIATPLAWWSMNKWLEGYAYRTDISWWIFIVAGILTALIALLTISYNAIKASVTNPVTSLRSE